MECLYVKGNLIGVERYIQSRVDRNLDCGSRNASIQLFGPSLLATISNCTVPMLQYPCYSIKFSMLCKSQSVLANETKYCIEVGFDRNDC